MEAAEYPTQTKRVMVTVCATISLVLLANLLVIFAVTSMNLFPRPRYM